MLFFVRTSKEQTGVCFEFTKFLPERISCIFKLLALHKFVILYCIGGDFSHGSNLHNNVQIPQPPVNGELGIAILLLTSGIFLIRRNSIFDLHLNAMFIFL